MTTILIFFLIIICVCCPTIACVVFHPFKTTKYAVTDTTKYIKHKKWNNAPFGNIIGYIADSGKKFGCGKTLTAVQYLAAKYRKYNDKMVWCPQRKKMVKQKVLILSNVKFKKIPYIKFNSLSQYVSLLDERYKKDQEEDTLTVVYALIDEASSILNSRSFKTNLSGLFIQSLLTCRHYHSALYYTSQKSRHTDALLRSVTSHYEGCDKLWRLQRVRYYDVDQIEYATDPTMVKPYMKKCWFIEDKHFDEYDTYEQLQDIKKKCEEGDMLSEEEILANLQLPEPNEDAITKPSRKYRKARKKMNK